MIQQAAALYQQKDYESAEMLCRKILRKEPENSTANHLMGIIYYEKKGFEKAISYLHKTVELTPDNTDAIVALASSYEQLKQYKAAIHYFECAYTSNPNQHNLLFQACRLLEQTGHAEKAVSTLASFLNKNPGDIDGLFQLIHLCMRLKDYSRAKDSAALLLHIIPHNSEAWNLTALIESSLGRTIEAKHSFSQALKLDPNHFHAKLNFASYLQDQGLLRDAKRHYLEIISSSRYSHHKSSLQKVYYNLALIELGYGDFQNGWMHLKHRPKNDSTLPCRSTLNNKNILIKGEEGLGDELMFLRFIPMLKDQNNHITYLTSAKLADVLSTVSSIDKVVTREADTRDYDVALSLMDLPIIFETNDPNSLPPPLNLEKAVDPHNITQALVSPSYMKKACVTNQVKTTFFITLFKTISRILFARPTAFSRLKLVNSRKKPAYLENDKTANQAIVGLSWRAGKLDNNSSTEKFLNKEIPLSVIKKIFSHFQGTIIVLQRDLQIPEFQELVNALTHIKFINASNLNNNLSIMLSTLDSLDAYIGVSNTNMHLYGSLAKKGCVITPYPGEWRWMYEGSHSPWYPDFTLIRQHNKDNWGNVIDESQHYLNNLNHA